MCSKNVRKRYIGNELNCLARDPWRFHLKLGEASEATRQVRESGPGSQGRLLKRAAERRVSSQRKERRRCPGRKGVQKLAAGSSLRQVRLARGGGD